MPSVAMKQAIFLVGLTLRISLLKCASNPDFPYQESLESKNCRQPLGLENGAIPNFAIAASSTSANKSEPFMGRRNTSPSVSNLSCWRAGYNRKQQWLRVDLGKVQKITSVATQGNPLAGEWVTDYVIEFGFDDKHWAVYREKGARKIFKANRDSNTTATNFFTQPLLARYVRLKVIRWKKHIALRLELYGCDAAIVLCLPLGVEDRRIPNKAFTASSSCNKAHLPASARLHVQTRSTKAAGWQPKELDEIPWIQVDLQGVKTVTGIGTQGGRSSSGRGGWVANYTVAFSEDGKTWQTHNENGSVKTFPGNNDASTVFINKLSSPFRAQSVRIYPLRAKNKGYLRFELYGCRRTYKHEEVDECSSSPCRNDATCANHVGNYTCACLPGFTGRNCEVELCRRCGRRTTSRIVGGNVALPGAWPWHVGLLQKGATKIFCGGALINKEWLVTAAHCVLFRTASSLRVVLGEFDVKKKEGIEVYRDVLSVHSHPDYNWITANHDIALVRIKPALNKFNRFISPVCLPVKDDIFSAGTNCTITGFGRLKQGGIIATRLRQAVVPLVDKKTCKKAYPSHKISPQMTCAGYTQGGIDSCQGDSGGPLVCRKDSLHWYLVGVISWGIGCAHPKSYGVYNNVKEERKWIDEELARFNSTACTEKI